MSDEEPDDSRASVGTENPKQAQPGEDFDLRRSNLVKDPEDWVTGEERMTDAQASYLKTLCEETGAKFDPDLTKAEASEKIDELKRKAGRKGTGRSREPGG
ncbi:MAG: DUF3072 domain-containing protein [Thermoanaerobaculia bacterium]|nr:DUF3072 domain-containing protein [Thermoanaerobaculia bacterium]